MRKQLVIIGIIAILVCVGLSRCIRQQPTNNRPVNEHVQLYDERYIPFHTQEIT